MKKFLKVFTFISRVKTEDIGDWKFKSKVFKFEILLEVFLITKESNNSRCTDLKQLLKVQALVRVLPG